MAEFRRGFSFKVLLIGLVLLAASIMVFVHIPDEAIHSSSEFNEILLGISGIMFFISLSIIFCLTRFDKCYECDIRLKNEKARFSPDKGKEVLAVVESLTGKSFDEVGLDGYENAGLVIDLSYCPSCRSVGELSLKRRNDHTTLFEKQIVESKNLDKLIGIIEAHVLENE